MTNKFSYDTISQIKSMLRDTETIRRLFSDKNQLADLLLKILEDTKYDLDARAEIAWMELYKIVNSESEKSEILIEDKGRLQNILLKCLSDKMDELKRFDGSINGLYLKNLEDILPGSRKIIITDEANLLMKKFILKYPVEYLKKFFLREYPDYSRNGRFYHLDPFLLYYFKNRWSEIEEFILSKEVRDLFVESNLEVQFYTYLTEAITKAQQSDRDNGVFLVVDKQFIETVSQFIIVKHN